MRKAEVERLPDEDPQAHGYAATDWTVPLLHTELSEQDYDMSTRALRKALSLEEAAAEALSADGENS